MTWLRLVAGIVIGLIGLVWLGQGLNLIKGSMMTGQLQWAVIGLVLIVVAAWLLWGFVRSRASMRSTG